jgi:hypothetical protein
MAFQLYLGVCHSEDPKNQEHKKLKQAKKLMACADKVNFL